MVGNAYFNNLIMTVINASESSEWREAVDEWEICDCEEDEDCSAKCICGKENIRYLYTIRNIYNGEILFPIGSSCINKFGRKDLNDETGLIEEQFRLLHAVESNKYLSLSADFFLASCSDGCLMKALSILRIISSMVKRITNSC